ncbi:hypothetical protein M569_03599 [Genlisea aurea]|uniref:Uncharacterized protein n=1 Tax=Genlisea aurea TaxID=192259 RepID=S8E5S9_9LAMI|nr:hypothetical protein M569_03599 [Genlisea aurea]
MAGHGDPVGNSGFRILARQSMFAAMAEGLSCPRNSWNLSMLLYSIFWIRWRELGFGIVAGIESKVDLQSQYCGRVLFPENRFEVLHSCRGRVGAGSGNMRPVSWRGVTFLVACFRLSLSYIGGARPRSLGLAAIAWSCLMMIVADWGISPVSWLGDPDKPPSEFAAMAWWIPHLSLIEENNHGGAGVSLHHWKLTFPSEP